MRLLCRRGAIASACLLCLALGPFATAQVVSSPASWNFPNTDVAKVSGSKAFTITNNGSTGVTINTVSFDCPQFKLASGVAPIGLNARGGITHYSAYFAPDAGQTYSCNMVITIQNQPTLNVPLTGKGVVTTGNATLSSTTLAFGALNVGSTSATQTVTITNTGGQRVTLQQVSTVPPNYVVTVPVTLPYIIQPSTSVSLSVTYSPSAVQSDTGVIDFTYDAVPDNGVLLTGSGTAANTTSINTLALLPPATVSSPYQVQLQASGGKAPYNFGLANGTTLPKGLKGSKNGLISGTLDPTVVAGAYTFTVFAKDVKGVSSPNKTLTLNVYAAPGGNCANTVWNIVNTTTPITALNDLATATYLGSQGGLYPNGTNVRPADHDADGVSFAQGIQPLDSNGNPDPINGKMALVGIGESTAQNEWGVFLPIAKADPQINPQLVIVNAAQGGATPKQLADFTTAYWATILNNYVPDAGITAKQVVAVWIESSDGIATGTFPGDMTTMQSEYESVAQNVLTAFPNVKLLYYSPRIYAGYSNGVSTVNPEPYAYETGFAIKWAIQDQLNGAANLNYKASNGPVLAPWMAWGPYYWSNGMLGRSDGLTWACQDLSSDGTHPSPTSGKIKVANQLLNFFQSDTTTSPWFLKH